MMAEDPYETDIPSLEPLLQVAVGKDSEVAKVMREIETVESIIPRPVISPRAGQPFTGITRSN